MKKQKKIKIESLKKNEIRKCLRRVRKSKENSHVQKALRLCENRRLRLKNLKIPANIPILLLAVSMI